MLGAGEDVFEDGGQTAGVKGAGFTAWSLARVETKDSIWESFPFSHDPYSCCKIILWEYWKTDLQVNSN